ncbi:MAG: A24 family peptidase [Lachnoclostridium sp.]|nr:A24 family peptidase [Lachnoclostridium sp.]
MRTVIFVIYLAVLIAVAWIDWKTQTIPDIAVIFIGILGMIAIPFFPEITLIDRVAGVFSISLPLLLIAVIVPGAFGGGDVKLVASSGFMIGWRLSLHAFVIAVLTGGVYAGWLLLTGKGTRKSVFAFGPFLCFGIIVVWC